MTYNLFYTSLVTMLYVFEQDVSPLMLLHNPRLYSASCQRGDGLTGWTMAQWVLRALYQAVVLTVFARFTQHGLEGSLAFGPQGQLSNALETYTACVLVHPLTIALESSYVTWVHHAVLWGTVGLFVATNLALARLSPRLDLANVYTLLLRDPEYYLRTLVLTALCIIPVVAIKYYYQRSDITKGKASKGEPEATGQGSAERAGRVKKSRSVPVRIVIALLWLADADDLFVPVPVHALSFRQLLPFVDSTRSRSRHVVSRSASARRSLQHSRSRLHRRLCRWLPQAKQLTTGAGCGRPAAASASTAILLLLLRIAGLAHDARRVDSVTHARSQRSRAHLSQALAAFTQLRVNRDLERLLALFTFAAFFVHFC